MPKRKKKSPPKITLKAKDKNKFPEEGAESPNEYPPLPSVPPVVTFKCESVQDVDDLIKDLREARRTAKRSGGAYCVGRECVVGKKVVGKFVIEMQFPIFTGKN